MKKHILAILVLAVVGTTAGMATPIVTPVAPAGPIYAGATFWLGVDISDAAFINGYQFDLAFDPTLLQFVALEEGTFLPAPLFAAPLYDSSDLANGNLLAIANYMADAGINGFGRLVNFQFMALATGTAAVTATGGLYTSLDDWDYGTQTEIQTNTLETIYFDILQAPVAPDPIPEPSTALLMLSGFAALAWFRRRT